MKSISLARAALLLGTTLTLSACGQDTLGGLSGTGRYVDRVTGEECTPDLSTLSTSASSLTAADCSDTGEPSGSGDNMDDSHSGQIDCFGDGNSGEGNDNPNCRCGSSDDSTNDDSASDDDSSDSDDSSDDGTDRDVSSDSASDEPACDANGCCEA